MNFFFTNKIIKYKKISVKNLIAVHLIIIITKIKSKTKAALVKFNIQNVLI